MATEPSPPPPAALHRRLHRLFARLSRFALINVGHAADKGALHVAEGVSAQALDAQLQLDLFTQQVRQRTGAGQLHLAKRIAYTFSPELSIKSACSPGKIYAISYYFYSG